MSDGILMHKGIALWLAKRTTLSNKQIAVFCNLHEIEINAFRMGLEQNLVEVNPIDMMLLSEENIRAAEENSSLELEANTTEISGQKNARKSRAYMKRHEVVNAIFWMVNNYPDMPAAGIVNLFQCTKSLVTSIKEKTYKEYDNLIPRHPVVLELCTQEELDKVLIKYKQA